LETSIANGNRLVMDGAWNGPFAAPATGMAGLIARTKGKGLGYEAALVARLEGGRSEAAGDTLNITNANAVTLVLAIATSFVNYRDISDDPVARCRKVLDAAADKDFAALHRRHVDDFRGLMSRVRLQVGDAPINEKPTDERLEAVRAGGSDPNLEALAFQFGRYILASSSRAGGQAANLQGIWNEELLPPWGSKYTININAQMNYWPAEVCNLSECAQPFFTLIKDLSINGAETAKAYYGCDGWVAHHNTDLWRGTAPVDAARYGMWPVGGAWLCQHLWEHYAFTGDTNFLREYYPVMKGAAQFLLDVMVEEPKHHWLVTPFSMSPEHGYYDGEGKMCYLSPSPTMDVGIIRELFPHCIEAGRILGVDEDLRAKLQTALTRIPPYRIGKAGFVQEWIEDWEPGPQGHNVSANFPFYPGSSITLRGNLEFAAAYQKWMETHPPEGGFRLSWGIAMWARLERGDQVGSLMETYMQRAPAANLHNTRNNQSDASFGFTAAVAEALLQSHASEISLLPALPPRWIDGSVQGLRARGAFELDITWHNGKLVEAAIRSLNGGSTRLRYGPATREVRLQKGETYRWNGQ
jgi:alpha-L-fucosidase 2